MKRKRTVPKPVTNWLEDTNHPWFLPVNRLLGVITLISVAAVALETVSALSGYGRLFLGIEYLAVFIFTLEYLARVAFAEHKLRYVISPFGLIDLVAIIPSYIGLTNLTFLKAARTVRIIRFLRAVRLAKFAHIKRQKNAAQSLYTLNVEIYIVALFSATLILGTLFYVFELSNIASIPAGMYQTLKIILGGMTITQPETIGGTVTLVLARFTSMILLGMLVGLVGNMVRKLLIGSEKDDK